MESEEIIAQNIMRWKCDFTGCEKFHAEGHKLCWHHQKMRAAGEIEFPLSKGGVEKRPFNELDSQQKRLPLLLSTT